MPRSGVEVKAQKECNTFFNLLGWAVKSDTEAQCPNCHTMLYPKHTGMADYVGHVRDGGPVAVEVKGTEDRRWLFSKWNAGQRRWAQAWNTRVSPDWPARFLWLQIGPEAVDSTKVELRRSVWLVPQVLVLAAEDMLAGDGLKSIPMNAAAMTKGNDVFEHLFHATSLFLGYQMEWKEKFGWWPYADSQIWSQLRIAYHDPEYFVEFNRLNPHPDSVGTDTPKGEVGATVHGTS